MTYSEIQSHTTNQSDHKTSPVPYFGMWVTFLYILLFISLYISFSAFGGILHHAVDQYMPDALNKSSSSFSPDLLLKWYLASIIVAFPVFAILFLILKKQVLETPAVKNLKARKVLIYITLTGTFVIIIGHLVGTVYAFLGGETTMRSLAHLAVTLIVAGSIFTYLLLEVKEDHRIYD